ncbi:urease subunit beta [Paenibacillus sp. LMG 31456]|uniref:Urease subunit beta n=1 Tax=Paenibacillus foliorum TaxID=2654974 RepID=A0A972K0F3_9BACL|nr:urease subunit beta [Paenibacillus foliorum]
MIPGEYRIKAGEIELNKGKKTSAMVVVNIGDRPIQVGSHFHFFEVNRALKFDRAAAFGMRLNIASGTAVRFEPGEEKPVQLVELGGAKLSYGLNNLSQGEAQYGNMPEEVRLRLEAWELMHTKQSAIEADDASSSPKNSADGYEVNSSPKSNKEGAAKDGKDGS